MPAHSSVAPPLGARTRTRRPAPFSLGRSVASRPARARLARFPRRLSVPRTPTPRSHAPLPFLQHLCAGAAGCGSIRVFPEPSGDRAASAAAEDLPWQEGRGWGKAKAQRGVKPEPPRAGFRGRWIGNGSGGRKRAGRGARRPSRAFRCPARTPEMHLHQVLTGAVNPGDNCYSVGSVGDVPFTVSGGRQPAGETGTGGRGSAPWRPTPPLEAARNGGGGAPPTPLLQPCVGQFPWGPWDWVSRQGTGLEGLWGTRCVQPPRTCPACVRGRLVSVAGQEAMLRPGSPARGAGAAGSLLMQDLGTHEKNPGKSAPCP